MSSVTAERLFHEFWTELQATEIALKKGESVSFVQRQLTDIFDKQRDKLKNSSSALFLYYDTHIKYILTVAADEYFISQCKHKEWVANLLEEKVFQTHVGGVKIFDDIQHLLHSKDKLELGSFYILLLGLGFKGRYYQNAQELAVIKRNLFELVHERSYSVDLDSIFKCTDEKFFASATPKTRQAKYHLWLAVVAMVYLGASYAIWEWQSAIVAQEVAIGNHNSFS